MSSLAISQNVAPAEVEMVELLSHRYGDGNIYLPAGAPRGLLVLATRLGYISEDGYLTRKGRQLLARYHCE